MEDKLCPATPWLKGQDKIIYLPVGFNLGILWPRHSDWETDNKNGFMKYINIIQSHPNILREGNLTKEVPMWPSNMGFRLLSKETENL